MVARLLRQYADQIENGGCDCSLEEQCAIFDTLSHRAISKEDATSFLHISRSTFDTMVRNNILPKGQKRRGFKELVWYEDELRKCVIECKNGNKLSL